MNFHKRVLLGSLVVVFDFNIDRIDVLPDVLGFFLIATAFDSVKTREALIGKTISLVLAIISFILLFTRLQPIGFPVLYSLYPVLVESIVGALIILQLAYVFIVSTQRLPELGTGIPKVFLGAQLFIYAATGLTPHFTTSDAGSWVIGLLVISIICYIYYFGFLWKRKSFERETSELPMKTLVQFPQ
ncbi:hypothetical protein MKY84_04075 [Chryseomicrobium sp. FSL W7-1435]|uniref:hypothetical protein n=1 Tax=Chryseomicrobium sp. FSL W7-1435 TaxID=2921704 RepID=UPI003159F7EB